jgi:8-oxo-dGTP diphosphatase
MAEASDPSPPTGVTAALSAAVFVRRSEQILIIRRAVGEMSGTWFIPGGGMEPGETLRETAIRELHEETGLAPSGPLEMVGHALIPAYGVESLMAFYACPCDEGEVLLNEEHTRARWIDAHEYRERYFTDEILAGLEAADARAGRIVRGVRENVDRYLELRALHAAAARAAAELRE